MYSVPNDVKEFAKLKPWWRTKVPTNVVLSADGIGDLYAMLAREGRKPFFVIDKALETQPEFARVFAEKTKFIFDATFSEPRTGGAHLAFRRDDPPV